MQEELLQFKMQKVWVLVDLPNEKKAIGHTQEEGIDYEEVFSPVTRIEAIRLFLAYASFMGFTVYQMDVKSDSLYGTIKEEVYVCQPPGFEDPDYPDKVYVNDIIFGFTNKDLCKAFEKLMKDKFQRSSMGELTLFLGLQVKQKPNGIFISQDKYIAEILRKFGLTDGKSASTPIDTEKPLLKDPNGEDVDVHTYRSMIGSLMYLTLSRLDIMFAVCACARFQVTPKASHLHAVKRIFRYLNGKPHLGLWYPKDSFFNLVAYSDSDYPGASLDRKSTTGAMDLKSIVGLWVNDVVCLQALTDRKRVIITEAIVQEVLRLDDAESIDCLPNEEIFTELSRMGYKKPSTKLTFYKEFFSAQWKVGKGFSEVETPLFDVVLTPPPSLIAQPSLPSQQQQPSQPTTISMDLLNNLLETCTVLTRRVENLKQDKIAQALEITKLKQRVRKLEKKKLRFYRLKGLRKVGTTQRIESSADTIMDDQEDASKQGEIIANIDVDEDVSLKDVFAVAKEVEDDVEEPTELQEVIEVVSIAKLMTEVVTAATTPIIAAIITAAPSAARRRKWVVIRDLEETVAPSIIIHTEPKSKDKGKWIMVEEPKPLKKQAQIEQDEAFARELEEDLNKNIN
nr:hypothetical protein [Tanacetum cinerariifolium]